MWGQFPSAGYRLARSGAGGHTGGFVWAGGMLPTKLIMTERERNWKSLWRCLKATHILTANFHLLANREEDKVIPAARTLLVFPSVFPSNVNLPSLFRCGEIRRIRQNENMRLYKYSCFVLLFLSAEYTQRSYVIGCGIRKIKSLREKIKTVKSCLLLRSKTRKKWVSLSAPHYQQRWTAWLLQQLIKILWKLAVRARW